MNIKPLRVQLNERNAMELVARLRLILPHSHYDKQVVGQAADFIERIARSENLKRVITNG